MTYFNKIRLQWKTLLHSQNQKRQSLLRPDRYDLLFCSIVGCAWGILAFLLLYGTAPLDVTNDTWIMSGYTEWDIQQRYAGWVGFRLSDWQFPLGSANAMGYPNIKGMNIAFMDAMPGVAIFFKLFSAILPKTFQFEGIYGLLAMMLQGTAAACLLRQFDLCKANTVIGTGFFAFSPIMIERMFRHTSLASHYLILFSMLLYFKYRKTDKLPKGTIVLAALSVGITPYFLPMVMVFALLLALESVLFAKKSPLVAVAWLFANGMAGIAVAFCIGSIGSGYSASRDGYGFYSMNLNALINPRSNKDYTWSRFLPKREQLYGQYDGFNYLGVGVIVMILVLLLAALFCMVRHREAVKLFVRRNGLLLLVALGLTMFATSNVVCFDGWELVNVPLPAAFLKLCGIFRASSRLFYPVYYLMLLGAVVGLSRLIEGSKGNVRLSTAALACMLALQLWDISGMILEKHTEMNIKATLDLQIPQELLSLEEYEMMITRECWGTRMEEILAAKSGLITNCLDGNTGSEDHSTTYRYSEAIMGQLEQGSLNTDIVYSTTDENEFEQWKESFGEEADFYVWDLNLENVHVAKEWRMHYFMVPRI